jgi:hypothetical protein
MGSGPPENHPICLNILPNNLPKLGPNPGQAGKSQYPNPKFQIIPNDPISLRINLSHSKLEFGYYLGFGAWRLVLWQFGQYFVAI